MRFEHPLIQASRLMDNVRPIASGMYILHAVKQKLVLEKRETFNQPPGHITTLTSVEINLGPTGLKWDLIDHKIRKLRKEGLL